MNTETGNVISEVDLKKHIANLSPEVRTTEERKWVKFDIGEIIEVKGIRFTIHDVSNQRLVLKFAK